MPCITFYANFIKSFYGILLIPRKECPTHVIFYSNCLAQEQWHKWVGLRVGVKYIHSGQLRFKISDPKENISTSAWVMFHEYCYLLCPHVCQVCCAWQSMLVVAHLKEGPFFPWIQSYSEIGTKNLSKLQLSLFPSATCQERRCVRYYPQPPADTKPVS